MPLAGLTVLDFGQIFQGSYATLLLAKAGATAVIQPGGSVNDADVIAAADAQGLAMVFTGLRHFRH